MNNNAKLEFQPALKQQRSEYQRIIDDVKEYFPDAFDEDNIDEDSEEHWILELGIYNSGQVFTYEYLIEDLGVPSDIITEMVNNNYLHLIDEGTKETGNLMDLANAAEEKGHLYNLMTQKCRDEEFIAGLYDIKREVEEGKYKQYRLYEQLELLRLPEYLDIIKKINDIDTFLQIYKANEQ